MVETRGAKRKEIDVNVEISRKEVEKNAKKKKVEKNETTKTTEQSATVTDDVLPMNYLVEAVVAVGSERSAPTSEEEKDGDEDGNEDAANDEEKEEKTEASGSDEGENDEGKENEIETNACDENREEESLDDEEEKEQEEEFEATESVKPSRMFLIRLESEYKKQIKLGTRCMIVDVIDTFLSLEPAASDAERRNDEEKALLGVIHDCTDIDVDSWIKRINEGYTVLFEDMYEKDIAARQVSERSVNAKHAVLECIVAGEEVVEQKKILEDVMKKMGSLGNQLERVMSIVENLRKGWGRLSRL
ncbi:hypothetical protein F2Q69_00047127 [Brassica cretica]|uniref:DUF287 domain-containing protein n=1 Tax=Brassica cretica TaxID=69181 RepID=A0A8S9PXH2_BRACR|nr:hypothetical protein F2Q69_00047127 [Brassica cretica]